MKEDVIKEAVGEYDNETFSFDPSVYDRQACPDALHQESSPDDFGYLQASPIENKKHHMSLTGPGTLYPLSIIPSDYYSQNQVLSPRSSNQFHAGYQHTGTTGAPLIQEQWVIEGVGCGSVDSDEAYNSYQSALRDIFLNIRTGMLVEASSSILQISGWLLSHVEELGLTTDDELLHGDRIKMWDEFNNAWLAALQKQKDLTLECVQNEDTLRHLQNLIPLDFLKKMGDVLVRLCDNIDKHGLVDYQYGVAESLIIDVLTECEALLKQAEGGPQ